MIATYKVPEDEKIIIIGRTYLDSVEFFERLRRDPTTRGEVHTMKKAKKTIASLVIAGMALTIVPFNAFATGTVSPRLSGITAAQTAVEIANQIGWTGTAILASSASYGMVDALTAGPLAFYLEAPILLTGAGNVLDADTKAELVKLAVTKVYVTSGTAVISQAVLTELLSMKITVIPLGGFDSAATSVNIASKMVGVTKVAVANGLQDALSIAAIASAANEPILLTDKDALPDSVAAFLTANPAITASDVIGGTGIISDAVKAMVPNATRHAGYTAYDTNNQIIQDFNSSLTYGNVYVANGATGIDALAGAPLAAQTKSAIILTDGVKDPTAGAFVKERMTSGSVVTALGGPTVVPEYQRNLGAVAPSVLVQAATDAVVKAEASKLDADVISAKALVDSFADDVAPATTKADLLVRLKAATTPVIISVGSKSNTNTGNATTDKIKDTKTINFEDIKGLIAEQNIDIQINQNDRLKSEAATAHLKRTIKDLENDLKDIDDQRDRPNIETASLIALGAEKRRLLDTLKQLERDAVDLPTSIAITDLQASMSDDTQALTAESTYIAYNQLDVVSSDTSLSIGTIQDQLMALQLKEKLGLISHTDVNDLNTKLLDLQNKLESTKLQQEFYKRQLQILLNLDNSIKIGSIPISEEALIIEDQDADLKKALENSYTIKLQNQQIVNFQSVLDRAEKDNGLSSYQYKEANYDLSNANLKLTQLNNTLKTSYYTMIDNVTKLQSSLTFTEKSLADKKVAMSEAELKLSLGMLSQLERNSAITAYQVQDNAVKTTKIELFKVKSSYVWLLRGMPGA